jgi:hypothetical protein
MEQATEIWDKFWRDREGKVVIWQTPNAFLIGWAVLTTISLFLSGKASDVFAFAAEANLVVWALLEIFKGVNYFRRALGLVVLIFAIMSFLRNF